MSRLVARRQGADVPALQLLLDHRHHRARRSGPLRQSRQRIRVSPVPRRRCRRRHDRAAVGWPPLVRIQPAHLRPNFSADFVDRFARQLNLSWNGRRGRQRRAISSRRGSCSATSTHCSTRPAIGSALRLGCGSISRACSFPHKPALFRSLSLLGARLVEHHLLRGDPPLQVAFEGSRAATQVCAGFPQWAQHRIYVNRDLSDRPSRPAGLGVSRGHPPGVPQMAQRSPRTRTAARRSDSLRPDRCRPRRHARCACGKSTRKSTGTVGGPPPSCDRRWPTTSRPLSCSEIARRCLPCARPNRPTKYPKPPRSPIDLPFPVAVD